MKAMSARRQNPLKWMGQQEKRETRQTSIETIVMVLRGTPDPSFLLQHLPFPFSYQISILSVTIGRCHTNEWPWANLMQAARDSQAPHTDL